MHRRFFLSGVTALVALSASRSAYGCRINVPLQLDDIKYADVVVIGRVSNYRIVRDLEFRRKKLANPNLPSSLRQLYEGPSGIISDNAHFDIQVDEVLIGTAPARLSVIWDNSTFGEPDKMAAGPYLIALLKLPLRDPSATALPDPEPVSLTVLQAPCSIPFILDSSSDVAHKVRLILGAKVR